MSIIFESDTPFSIDVSLKETTVRSIDGWYLSDDGKYHHYCVTFDNGRRTEYVDGTLFREGIFDTTTEITFREVNTAYQRLMYDHQTHLIYNRGEKTNVGNR